MVVRNKFFHQIKLIQVNAASEAGAYASGGGSTKLGLTVKSIFFCRVSQFNQCSECRAAQVEHHKVPWVGSFGQCYKKYRGKLPQ
jgi:hypothetical protein